MKNLKFLGVVALGMMLFFSSCKDKEEFGTLTLALSHEVDGEAVTLNEYNYTNEAGYNYSITHLEYYISEINLEGDDGLMYSDPNFYYVDFEDETTHSIRLEDVPYGNYTKVSFKLGLDETYNTTGALPNETVHNSMAWPDPMGGGYHFMKFEGNYLDGGGSQQGFGMHLGKTGNHSECTFTHTFQVENETQTQAMVMNMNEWFRNPHVFDFATDGTSIMGNDASLQKLSENGDDVFSGN